MQVENASWNSSLGVYCSNFKGNSYFNKHRAITWRGLSPSSTNLRGARAPLAPVVPPPLVLLNSHIQGIQSTCSLTWPDPHVHSESLRLYSTYRTSHQSSFSHNWNNSHFGQVATFASIPHSIPYFIQFSIPHSVFYKQLCQRNAYVSLVVMVTWTLNTHFYLQVCFYNYCKCPRVQPFLDSPGESESQCNYRWFATWWQRNILGKNLCW